ncbi:hypothetical protein EDM53_03950 [Rickettsiales endosymbiont of Peranema trichophorum]|uniref:VirB4 family type IV secretion/conjugal transfer ATPase n=1 Tax=Rickettsiales endosymbiont of Peranema trichophorum TaxID=2486577 RepID=UPI001022AC83|nr:hypothetical protein [Rickettsiales endosymbiont of Peranema trichophorum]RZI46360.1 hypothetical protein EDM53_03950 [Rickettsiales endosymbiont of Peranema trichophorum]
MSLLSGIKYIEDNNFFVRETIADCIPIACHYDANTLLTKNGQLLQIIRVPGFEPHDDKFRKVNLRELVREVVKDVIVNSGYAVYVHVLRDRRDIRQHASLPFGFADMLDKKWSKKNNWDQQFVNTLFITIVGHAVNIPLFNPVSFVFSAIKHKYFKHLESTAADLSRLTAEIEKRIERFSAKALTIVPSKRGMLSEPLWFYRNLVQFIDRPSALPIKDLSESLSNIDIRHQFNTMEIVSNESTRYVAMYTVKQAQNLPVEVYDKLLQLGTKFVISEVIYPMPPTIGGKEYNRICDILAASKSTGIIANNDLGTIAKLGQDASYCAHQITIAICSDHIDFFQAKINMITKVCKEIGILIVREDFNMARCFWAQLPGNFKFICRPQYTVCELTCPLSSIHHQNRGVYNGSKWGPYVLLFRNFDGNPYYFNFHRGESGNTLVVGPKGAGKTVLMRFFITQTMKLAPKVIYINLEGRSANFTKAIGGTYINLKLSEFGAVKICPWDMGLVNNDIKAMEKLLTKMLLPDISPTADQQTFISSIVTAAFGSEGPQTKDEKYLVIQKMIQESSDPLMKRCLNGLLSAEVYSKFFDEDYLDCFKEDMISIDLSELSSAPAVFEMLGLLIALKLESLLQGQPTIVVIDKFDLLLKNEVFAQIYDVWLRTLTSLNAIAFVALDPSSYDCSTLTQSLEAFATKIFMSDKFANRTLADTFQLSEWELIKIKSYDQYHRMFLVKQLGDSIIGVLNLSEFQEELSTLIS